MDLAPRSGDEIIVSRFLSPTLFKMRGGHCVYSKANRENKLVYTAKYVGKAREIRRRVVSE
jgi:hypothetical protein